MKPFLLFLLLLPVSTLSAQLTLETPSATATDSIATDSIAPPKDSINHYSLSPYAYDGPNISNPRPWRAAIEATAINVGVHVFDRFVLNEDFAKSTFKTTWNNIRHGFVWDNDKFSTNLFAHPYHGNLYFNAARSNGLSFMASVPYAFGGSLMWEVAGEVEPPALNDLIATTIGGMAIGEVTHRLSALVYDDRTKGSRRFLRELVGTIINPIGGLNRLIDGRAWRVRTDYYKYHDYDRFPILFFVSVGNRYLADRGALFRGETHPYLALNLTYGDAFNVEENRPYDFFTANAALSLTGKQPLIHGVHLIGRLWGTKIETGTDLQLTAGLFQHYNYYDSEPVIDGSDLVPYRISEAASFGPGLLYRLPTAGGVKRFEQQLYVNAILLGGSLSDYYKVIDRDYNLGSGFSVKMRTLVEFQKYGRLEMTADFLRIFTIKGVEDKDISATDPLHLNVQGNRSEARLLVLRPNIFIHLAKNLDLHISAAGYFRRTNYKSQPDVSSHTFVVRLGVAYNL